MGKPGEPPKWIKPKFTRIADEAPAGNDWLHEIKYDGCRMHARLDRGKVQLLTRTGLDWSRRYPRTIEALRSLPVKTAYLDGELCALSPDGVPAFSRLQAAMDEGRTDELVLFVFDLLFLDGEITAHLPLTERKERLQRVFPRKSAVCATAIISRATVLDFASRPVRWGWRVSPRSGSTGPTRRATVGSGSSPSV